jgi:hypothetical protein
MIEVFDSGGDVLEKMLPGFCQPDAAVTSLKQKEAKILFELFDPRAERIGSRPKRTLHDESSNAPRPLTREAVTQVEYASPTGTAPLGQAILRCVHFASQ